MATLRGAHAVSHLIKRGWTTVPDPNPDDPTYGDPDVVCPRSGHVYPVLRAIRVQRIWDRDAVSALVRRIGSTYGTAHSPLDADLAELCLIAENLAAGYGEVISDLERATDENSRNDKVLGQLEALRTENDTLKKQYETLSEQFGSHATTWSREMSDARAACLLAVQERMAATRRVQVLEEENPRLREMVREAGNAFRTIRVNCESAFASDSHRGPKPFVDLIASIAETYRKDCLRVAGDPPTTEPQCSAPKTVKCHYCASRATKTVIWLKDKNKHPVRIVLPWCGCDLMTAIKRFWPNPYPIRENVDYVIETRTKRQVEAERRVAGSGCCDTYCNNSGCNCLTDALDDR